MRKLSWMIALLCPAILQAVHFCNKWHDRILTCNLKITDDNNLSKLFRKSPKYRENIIADYQKARKSVITGINACIQSWCDKYGVSTSSFFYMEGVVILEIDKGLAISPAK